MKKPIVLLLTIALSFSAFGQQLEKEYQNFISDFIYQVKHRQIEKLSSKIIFPLKREYPISDIKNKADFVKRYHEIFDRELVSKISSSKPTLDWSAVGWRGIMLFNGDVWLDYDGRLKAVNYQSEIEKTKRSELIRLEKNKLHISIKVFENPIHILETEKYRIRIDDLGKENYRYSSWPIKSKINDKPSLIITKGEYIPDGSGGNHTFRFKNKGYVYECAIIVMGENDAPPAWLTIHKDNKIILSSKAWIL